MKRANWRMVASALAVVAWGAVARGGTCPETVLDRQGDWQVLQADDGAVKTLFLEKSDGTARTPLARVEVPSATVTNVYWDEFAGWDAQGGKAVGGMVTNVETIAGEFTFRAFVNDGRVYWQDREAGLARLWSAPCKAPEAKTLLAEAEFMANAKARVSPRAKQSLVFNANGGEFEDGSQVVSDWDWTIFFNNPNTYDLWYTHHFQFPTRSGHAFDGWYTEASGGTRVKDGDPVTSASRRTLYAHWVATNGTSLAEATECEKLAFTTEGDVPWFGQKSESHDGTDAARSGLLAPDHAWHGSSAMSASVDGPGTISFWWKADGPFAEYDARRPTALEFLVDGEVQASLRTGPTDWRQESFGIGEGVHVLKWEYHGGGELSRSYYRGLDCGFVDQIEWQEAMKQTVTFAANGGTCGTETARYLVGEPYESLPEAAWEGHVFMGWFTEAEGGTPVTAEDEVSELEMRTLYAHWMPGQTVTFNGNGGDCATKTAIYPVGEAYGSLPEATRDGHVFLGWFTAANGGNPVTAADEVTKEAERMLHAHWAVAPNLAFHAPEGWPAAAFLSKQEGSLVATTYGVEGTMLFLNFAYLNSGEAGAGVHEVCVVVKDSGGAVATNWTWTLEGLEAGEPRVATNVAFTVETAGTYTLVVTLDSGRAVAESSETDNTTQIQFEVAPQPTWRFTLDDGVATVTGGEPATGDLVIPDVLDGCPVVYIGNEAFRDCSGLTSVTIPNSVTNIGDGAFSGCGGLTNVTIPDSVTNIGAFMFSGCSGLTGVRIPDSVTRIGEHAFYECSGLTSVTIPDSVTVIGGEAFAYCKGLTNVVIGNGVTSIGREAFSWCSGLLFDKTTIPGVYLVDGWVVSRDHDSSLAGALNLVGCRGIAGGTFSGCSNLTSVTIPDSVTSIGDSVFSGCSGLTSVTIPDSVTSIGGYAFSGCIGLASVTIPDGVTRIGDWAFECCSGLTNVVIGNGVTNIGGYAFSGCIGLASVTILGNVMYDWDSGCSPFSAHRNITTLVLGEKMTQIGAGMFEDCSGLTSVTIPDGVTRIGDCAFQYCSGLASVTIGNSVTNIGGYAFFGCSGLASVTIPDSVTSIGEYAFSGCSGLSSVTISNSVTSIGWGAFEYCRGLKELRVPEVWKSKYVEEEWGDTYFWSEYASVPSGCEIIYYEPGESGGAVAVPEEWMDKNAGEILAANGGDYAAAAKAEAANGMRVWECYLAGLSTTDAAAEFKVKSMAFVDGKVVVTWDPDLNEGDTKKERSYVVEGAETLGGAWGATNAASRFFRVKVALPGQGGGD